FFGDSHVVRGENHGGPFPAQIEDGFTQYIGIDWVQARERLIQDDKLRFCEYRGNELNFLRHAFRQSLDLLVDVFRESHPIEPAADQRIGVSVTLELRVKTKYIRSIQ